MASAINYVTPMRWVGVDVHQDVAWLSMLPLRRARLLWLELRRLKASLYGVLYVCTSYVLQRVSNSQEALLVLVVARLSV